MGEEEDILMRDVEGQGIGRTRNAGNHQAGCVIRSMHTCRKGIEKHIPVLGPHNGSDPLASRRRRRPDFVTQNAHRGTWSGLDLDRNQRISICRRSRSVPGLLG